MKKNISKSQEITRAFVMSVVVLAVILCVGCVQSENSEEKNLRIVLHSGPDTGGSLDPAYKWEGWYTRQTGIYETLFYYDTEMRLQPELATGYKQLNDTEWEIQLRKGVTFHDGTKMDADAVIYSINRVLDPSNSRSVEYSFLDSVYKTGEYTVVIKTKEPYAPAISAFADPVMSIVSSNAENLDTKPVGTGPFKFVSFESGASMDLEKNPDYWGGEPKIDTVSVLFNSDGAARSLMIMSKDVDISRDFQRSDYATLAANPDVQIVSQAGLRTFFLYVNGNKAPFNDTRVRQALSYVLNRQEIVDTALEGIGGVPATGIFSGSLPWNANDQLATCDNDQKKALELFSEAGITKGSDGKMYYNGEPFSIELLIYTKRSANLPTAEVIVSQLENFGIKSTIRVVDSSTIPSECSTGNYDLSLTDWVTAPSGDPDYFLSLHYLSTGSYAAWTGYSNTKVDELILKARTTFDADERYKLYDQVQVLTQNDMPLIPIFYGTDVFALSSNVTGFEIYPNELTVLTSKIDLK
ncbi:ABC transporter substrate-binding protein [Methanosarcina vacuolata]|uniref:Oligopeptide ABC transporter, periplasmic oligopeptide-binding protein OppA n=1 Tax=Methanosarcina vacuolata Z-761 TaxID=1434123 RepID=A0A0E3Q587_9EURY|nr:ABC transporter substrate-binding protein [Methanosarcina vacuolata]AKB44658.1 Oligopeptide ABC transporter, periplasmic oligopeptide-binding protein OppA [Methanosarcina vacuolata Z-761]